MRSEYLKEDGKENIRTQKDDERWGIRANKEIKDILHGADILQFIRFLRLGWYGHVERMYNQTIPTPTATATMEGARKRGRPSKRWRDDDEVD
jgi:hypothetical protein